MVAKTNFDEEEGVKGDFRDHGIVAYPGASQAVAAGARFWMTNAYGPVILEAQNSGTTNAGAEPVWDQALGAVTADNDIDFIAYHVGKLKRPLYIALFTGAPGETGGGVEVSGGSYARVQYNPADANWALPVAGNGVTSNLLPVTFPDPTGAWGNCTHWGMVDALTGGNLLKYAALTTPANIAPPATNITFAAGSLTFQEDN